MQRKELRPSQKMRREYGRKSISGDTWQKKKSLLPSPEEHDLAMEKADPSVLAGLVNERYGYTEIIAEYRRGGKVIVAERLNKSDTYSPNYRLKTTQYVFFTSKAVLQEYAQKNKIKLKYN